MEERGLVFNIQKFSIHDGPGIRTIVFLKGCPLHCKWCANPEGIKTNPQVGLKEQICIGVDVCGYCIDCCEVKAITARKNKAFVDFTRCNHCTNCVNMCPSKAFETFGKWMNVKEVLDEVTKDSAFYLRSGGGLTLSGGEPLLQPDFAIALLKSARNAGLETAIETCGCAPWENVKRVLQEVDFIHFDIKSLDEEKHLIYTGQSNQQILENFKKLCNTITEVPILVRTPIIPGFNNTVEDIQAIVDFVEKTTDGNSNVRYELLPFHNFADSKYTSLGQVYAYHEEKNMKKEAVQEIIDQLTHKIEIILK